MALPTFDETFDKNIYVITQSLAYGNMFNTENLTFAYDVPLYNQLVNKLGLNGLEVLIQTIYNSNADHVLYIQFEIPQDGEDEYTAYLSSLSYNSFSSSQFNEIQEIILDNLDVPVKLFQIKLDDLKDVVAPLNQSLFLNPAPSYSNTLINDQFLLDGGLSVNIYQINLQESPDMANAGVINLYDPNDDLPTPPTAPFATPILNTSAYRTSQTTLVIEASTSTPYPFVLLTAVSATDADFTENVKTREFRVLALVPSNSGAVYFQMFGLEPETDYYVKCKISLRDGTQESAYSTAVIYSTSSPPAPPEFALFALEAPQPILPSNLRTIWSATSSESSGVVVARPNNAVQSGSLLVASPLEQLKIKKPVVPVKVIKEPFVDKSLLNFIKIIKSKKVLK
jgi:hypothetical protein